MPIIISTRGLNDDDTTVGMGFSIFVTISSLLGLLFCFRKASSLLPRNLSIQLQRFGQNSNSDGVGRRGPIALSDEDLVGATGIEWEDIEAQLQGGDHGEDQEEEMEDMASRPLKPMSRHDRYLDDDEDEEGEEMSSNVNVNRPYTDDDDEDDGDANHEGTNAEAALGEGESTESQKDSLFKLEDADSD